MVNRKVCIAVSSFFIFPAICNAMNGMLDRNQITECLIQLADKLAERADWFSKLENKGWKAAGVTYEFERHVCSEKDREEDREIEIEIKKEILGKRAYKSILLEKLHLETLGPGIRTNCNEKLNKLKSDAMLYKKEFDPYERKLKELLEEEASKFSTELSQGAADKNKWSPIRLVRSVINAYSPEYTYDKDRSTTFFTIFCKKLNFQFDVCLAVDKKSLREHMYPNLQIALFFMPKEATKLGGELFFSFGYDEYFSPMENRTYSYYRTSQELERNTRFMLDAYEIILSDVSGCFDVPPV